ncbi:DJ-1/PfpI family protein [Myroides odoratus]|uniref:GlxA family transcriptional regulator n=1 Tax=Myroides odoratus TaxID=256 RepID=UPI00333E23C6
MKLYTPLALVLSLVTGVVMSQEKMKIGIFVYPEMELQDFAGPTDVFVKANRFTNDQYELLLFSEDGTLIETERNVVSITPKYSFKTLPKVDLILIPGSPIEVATTRSKQANIKQFLVDQKDRGTTLASVCTGAYFLANSGLLDGHRFTTHYLDVAELGAHLPNAEVVLNVRFVDSGQILTASGITSGIDLALYLVEQYSGQVIQDKIAKLMQYEYHVEQQWPEQL